MGKQAATETVHEYSRYPKTNKTMYIFGKLIWAGLGRVTSVSLQPCNERRNAQTCTRLTI